MIPAPLRIPAFRAFWLARLATTIAQMAMVIVIGWQVYDIARRSMDVGDAAFQLGLIGLVVRRPRDWRVIVTLWITAGLVLGIHAASQGVTPEFALPLYPVFIVTALGALAGERRTSPRVKTSVGNSSVV